MSYKSSNPKNPSSDIILLYLYIRITKPMSPKYIRVLLFSFFVLTSLYRYAQKKTYFQTLIKPNGNIAQQSSSILQLADRSFLVGGGYDFMGKHPKILIFKTDSIGRVLWTRLY